MTSSVLISIISGIIGAVAGSLTTMLFKRLKWLNGLKRLDEDKKRIAGCWTGTIKQICKDQEIEYGVKVKLCPQRRIVSGTALMEKYPGVDKEQTLTLSGGFFRNRFLKFKFKNADSRVYQFGTIMLERSTDGNKLKGVISGYGHISKKIVSGHVMLKYEGI